MQEEKEVWNNISASWFFLQKYSMAKICSYLRRPNKQLGIHRILGPEEKKHVYNLWPILRHMHRKRHPSHAIHMDGMGKIAVPM